MKKEFLLVISFFSIGIYAQEIEEISVTGSYIGTEAEKLSIQVIDQSDYNNLNITTVGEISKYLASSSGSHFQSNTLDGVDQGMASITLRGLDHASTLVLLNSKRQTSAGTFSHEGEGYIDINIVPEIALKQVEVLKEGASSLYGSEAVAGVVNFITQDDFIGTKISMAHQKTSNYDQSDKTLGFIFGKQMDNSHLVIAANFLDRSSLPSSEIPKIAEHGLSTLGNTFKVSEDDTVISGDYAGTYTSGQWVPDPNCVNNGGVLVGPFCKFLYGTRFNIVNDEDHKKFYLNYKKETGRLSYKLTTITSSVKVNDNPQSPSYPALSFMSKQIMPGQGGNPFNVPVTWYGRPLGSAFPSPISPKDIDQYHVSGLMNINLNDNTNIELSVTQSKHENFHNRPDTINSRMENAIAGSGGINGNQTWNIFDPLSNSPQLIEYIKGSEQSLKTSKLKSFNGIVRTSIRGNRVALGFQYRNESLDIQFNELARAEFDTTGRLIKAADLLFLGGGMNVSKDRNKKSFFMEIEKTLTDDLNLLFASRYEETENESSIDPKLSINYRLSDQVSLRGSIGTSFATASMAQLHSSEIALGGVRDVINGIEQTSSLFARIIQVGNPNLTPASSTNLNFGVNWNMNENLSLSLDYWKINFKDRLELEDPQAKISANPNHPDIQRNQYGDITAVSTTFFNEEKTEVKGLDFSLNYLKEMKNGNVINLGIHATHLFEFLTPEGISMVNRVGKFNYNSHTHSLPRLKLNAFWGLTHKTTQYTINTRYIDGYKNLRSLPSAAIANGYENKVDSFTVFDIGAKRVFNIKGNTLKLGLHLMNAFDEKPPLLYDAPDFSFDTRLHDPRGRLINLSLDYEF
jgi:iron complex outermembrane receptor protein